MSQPGRPALSQMEGKRRTIFLEAEIKMKAPRMGKNIECLWGNNSYHVKKQRQIDSQL